MNLAFGNRAAVAATLTPALSQRGERKRAPSPAVAGQGARCAVRKKGREAASTVFLQFQLTFIEMNPAREMKCA